MLTRQWQLGEFWGSDGGTPVQADLRLDCTPATRYAAADAPAAALDAMIPLEAVIECEPVRADSNLRLDLAAEAGLHLLRHLDPTGSLGYRTHLVHHFPLEAPATTDGQFIEEINRFGDTIGRRVPDGELLAWVVRGEQSPDTFDDLTESLKSRVTAASTTWRTWLESLDPASRRAVDEGIEAWLHWYDTLVTEPPMRQPNRAWLPSRMEYTATVSVPTRDREVVLAIPEHHGGHLDWYSFDQTHGPTLGGTRQDLIDWPWPDPEAETVHRTVIPSQVHYPGMPASRYWEFEDARVDFGAVTAGVQQLAHLLLVEFALVYGDGWFIIPVDMPVGAWSRVQWLVVTDTFGDRTLVPSARQVDTTGDADDPEWDMFRITGAPDPASQGMFLPPTLSTSLHGEAVEEVFLARDEMANMSWAIEKVIETPTGRALNRAESFDHARQEPSSSNSDTHLGQPRAQRYRLATDPPEHWLPLFPTRLDSSKPALHFVRGGQPRGQILEPHRSLQANPLTIHDEEIPREGARLTRSYQYARWSNGQTFLWMARQKSAGSRQGSSGLEFDVLDPNNPSQ
ncbi:hypothetical protein [Citricoccus sp. CH26A]|uniref:hypothetical protein n=1 Tax=Citricoccus TaxID=169133 RepID=UPI001145BFBC|nr:hypothetical protein [Citricoccus sp. CH26A]